MRERLLVNPGWAAETGVVGVQVELAWALLW